MTPRALPTGTVTFLFTDIEGSTRLLQELGPRWSDVIEEHNRILRAAIRDAGGIDVRTEGDAFFAVFPTAPAGVRAAIDAQRALHALAIPLRVRMGLHTGEGILGGDEYVGLDVHLAARIAASGHGGQVLLGEATAALVQGQLPAGVGLGDLGDHRLKDFERPQRLFHLEVEGLPADFPPLRGRVVATNVAPESSRFIGREETLERLASLLPASRLVTLTGPGGTGKTRVGAEAARRMAGTFRDGAWFVGLAGVRDPSLIPATIGAELGLHDDRGASVPLLEHLRERSMLLVLDNFEHLLDGAAHAAEILAAAPEVCVLVTSRTPLRIRGERELPLPPMAVPEQSSPVSEMEEVESVRLFVERASEIDPSFALTDHVAPAVAAICRRLEGLPLAIEMAASRVRALPPATILDRLGDRLDFLTSAARDIPERQRTLRATLDWSVQLLAPSERSMFARLGVFVGGWSLEAADEVANLGAELGDTLELITALIDASLVRRQPEGDDPRFTMLETMREYARQMLGPEAATIERRHALAFLVLAERALPELAGAEQVRWLDRLERDHDNLRAALGWAVEGGHFDEAARFVAALWRFWHLRGHLAEGRRWVERVLEMPGADERTASRVRALSAFGSVAYWQQDEDLLRAAYREALAIAEEVGDPLLIAQCTYDVAFATAIDDVGAAEEVLRRAREMFEEIGEPDRAAQALSDLAWFAFMAGRFEESLRLGEEALPILRRSGRRFALGEALGGVGSAATKLGDLVRAREVIGETLAMAEEARIPTGVIFSLYGVADVAVEEGRLEEALRLRGAADGIVRRGAGGSVPDALWIVSDVRQIARDAGIDEERIAAEWATGAAWTLEQAIAEAKKLL